MKPRLPLDILAEALINYYPKGNTHVSLRGHHSRNAYHDILDLEISDDNKIDVAISRPGMYDSLPEVMFHPIDRFDKIPANEYKERFAEECEKQQKEEENARQFFQPFDRFLFHTRCVVDMVKQHCFSGSDTLSAIVCDKEDPSLLSNRFISQALPFVAECRRMRGDTTLIALMLRRILNQEGISLHEESPVETFIDASPRYSCSLDDNDGNVFLGNEFTEPVITYTLRFWDEDLCDERFPQLVKELHELECFLNRYFMGIEQRLHLEISTDNDEVMLEESHFNYLNFNSNL